MTKYNQKRAALRFANRLRRMLGLPEVSTLRPGLRSESASCPIARTVKYGAGRRYVRVDESFARIKVGGETKMIPVPTGARYFIFDFDTRGYPDLIAKR